MSETGSGQRARIVVGVDGSAGSAHALRWAARQAGYAGATLEAVTAWQYPAFFGWAPVGVGQRRLRLDRREEPERRPE